MLSRSNSPRTTVTSTSVITDRCAIFRQQYVRNRGCCTRCQFRNAKTVVGASVRDDGPERPSIATFSRTVEGRTTSVFDAPNRRSRDQLRYLLSFRLSFETVSLVPISWKIQTEQIFSNSRQSSLCGNNLPTLPLFFFETRERSKFTVKTSGSRKLNVAVSAKLAETNSAG